MASKEATFILLPLFHKWLSFRKNLIQIHHNISANMWGHLARIGAWSPGKRFWINQWFTNVSKCMYKVELVLVHIDYIYDMIQRRVTDPTLQPTYASINRKNVGALKGICYILVLIFVKQPLHQGLRKYSCRWLVAMLKSFIQTWQTCKNIWRLIKSRA